MSNCLHVELACDRQMDGRTDGRRHRLYALSATKMCEWWADPFQKPRKWKGLCIVCILLSAANGVINDDKRIAYGMNMCTVGTDGDDDTVTTTQRMIG